ncbi:MAG: dTMP kinase [Xanthobacteraceae bacterium]|nr:MAG: dTMP kinase [Xanthobacteraceae bacterium]
MTVTATPSPVGRGRFITFEGGEGSGKSTQLRILASRLNAAGIRAITTREPGGSPGAEVIRYLVLSGVGKLFGSDMEALLFAAARDDHVHVVIEPALEQGTWVLCDRFTDSTRVYQGAAGDVDPRLLAALERVTIGRLAPDVTFILDVPVETGLARAAARRGAGEVDRFEQEGAEFHAKLRAAYRAIAEKEPARCVLVDATAEVDRTAGTIWRALGERLPEILTTRESRPA